MKIHHLLLIAIALAASLAVFSPRAIEKPVNCKLIGKDMQGTYLGGKFTHNGVSWVVDKKRLKCDG